MFRLWVDTWAVPGQDSDIRHQNQMVIIQETQLGSPNVCCVCVLDVMKRVWFGPDADTETGCEPRWTGPAGSSWALSSGFYNSKAKRSEAQFWMGSSRVRLHSQTTWAQSGREQSNHKETSCVQGQKHSTVEPKEMENMLLALPLKILYIKSFFNGFSRML